MEKPQSIITVLNDHDAQWDAYANSLAGDLQNQVNNLTVQNELLGVQVNALLIEKDALTVQISDLEQQIAELTADESSLQAQIVALQSQLAEVQSQLNAAETLLLEKDGQLADLQTENASLQNQIDQLIVEKSSLENQLVSLQNQNAQLTASLAALNLQVSQLQSTVNTQQSNIDDLNDQLAAKDQQIAALNSQISSNAALISQLQTQLTAAQVEIARLNALLNQNTGFNLSIISPTQNQIVTSNTVTINTSTVGSNANVTKVEFYDGNTKIGEDTANPYTLNWNVSEGQHTITAKAINVGGSSFTSAPVTFSVVISQPEPEPTVNLTSPSSNQSFELGQNINLAATVTNVSNGAVVEFYDGLTKIGQDVSSPYVLNWTTNRVGSLSLTAKVVDGSKNAQSAPIVVSVVNNAPNPENTYYVSKTLGNNSNPGTQSQPWRDCPGMHGGSSNSKTLQAGDVIYLDRADSWDVSSSSTSQGSSGAINMTPGIHIIGNVWNPQGVGENSGPGGRKRRAKLNITANTQAGIIRFDRDHPTIPTRIEGVEGDGNGFMTSFVDMNGRSHQNSLNGALKSVRDCYFHDGDAQDGSIYNYGAFIRAWSNHPLSNYELIDCEFENNPRDGIANYPENGATMTNGLIRGCVVHGKRNDEGYGEGHGIGIKGRIDNLTIEWCSVYDIWSSALYLSSWTSTDDSTNIVIRNNILCRSIDPNAAHNVGKPSGRGAVRFYSGRKAVKFYNNIILPEWSGEGSSLLVSSTTAVPGQTMLQAYNNTFYMAKASVGTNSIIFKNNIVCAPSGGTALSGTNSGNNILSNNGAGYAGFKNVNNLPLKFVGTYPNLQPDKDGLSVISGTALGGGVNLGAEFNTSINGVTRGSSWDVGAYQS